LKYLIQRGADVNAKRHTDGSNPIYCASQNGHKEIVEYLLKELKVNPNAPCNENATPLLMSAQYGYLDVVSLLLEHGADPNINMNKGDSPLTVAAYYGHKEVVEKLLEYGASLNQRDVMGHSAEDNATVFQHFDLLPIFEKCKNKLNNKTN